jgi:hypothetical protein
MSNNTFPESFNNVTDHFIITNELIIAAIVSMNGISQISAAVNPRIAETLVSASAITCR